MHTEPQSEEDDDDNQSLFSIEEVRKKYAEQRSMLGSGPGISRHTGMMNQSMDQVIDNYGFGSMDSEDR